MTVPAYFYEPQWRATIQAAELAGLEVISLISQTKAAVFANYFERTIKGTRRALVYDIGKYAFHAAIAEVTHNNVKMLCDEGGKGIGGQHINQRIINYCLKQFLDKEGIDVMKEKENQDERVRAAVVRGLCRLNSKIEQKKQWFITSKSVRIEIECFLQRRDLKVQLSRETFEELCKPLIRKSLEIVDKALDAAKVKGVHGKDQIDDLILVGGSSRILLVESMIREHFKGKFYSKYNLPEEAVALGSAIQAEIMKGKHDNRHYSYKFLY